MNLLVNNITDDPTYADMATKVIGQSHVFEKIVPVIQTHKAGLSPQGRPIGTVLLLGPTGTGKTRTVEALAEVLHGSATNVLRIDCGEFQMEHEVAKLIGAPPGYLGHRETQPMLSAAKLNAVTSKNCDISIVLFDEIEKASTSLRNLLLGILDKAQLKSGDNSVVSFESSMIFLTSNLGVSQIEKIYGPDFGFGKKLLSVVPVKTISQVERMTLAAVKKHFSPEFVNRIDHVITYHTLERRHLHTILDLEAGNFSRLLTDRLGMRAFRVVPSNAARERLLDLGTSAEYGARELKRTLHRHLFQPLAAHVAAGRIPPGSIVNFDVKGEEFTLSLEDPLALIVTPQEPGIAPGSDEPTLRKIRRPRKMAERSPYETQENR